MTTLPSGVLPGGRFEDWRPGRPQYVVCDVDGTLVGPKKLASTEVVEAIGRAQESGLRVGYATGRMRDGVAELQKQLNGVGPHIVHNGAEVLDGDTTVAVWPLTAGDVDALLAIAREHDDIYVEIYPESGFFISSWDERARPHWDSLDVEPSAVITAAAELGGAPVRKATFAAFTDGLTDGLIEQVKRVGLVPGAAGSPRTPGIRYVNATHPDADKGKALQRAVEYLQLSLQETVAIGDAANDLPMLARAGTSIAMGQAPATIKDAAHLIVPDVDAHGVAVALDAILEVRAH